MKTTTEGSTTYYPESTTMAGPYTKYPGKDCSYASDIHSMPGDIHTDNQACKDWCDASVNCGGFAYNGWCWFKDTTCFSNIYEGGSGNPTLYIKN